MPLQVPSQDRILNRYAVVNPDKTILNAENVMLIFDNLINGQYALKPAKQYATYAQLQAETGMEQGQTAYVLEQGYNNRIYVYNGTQWIAVGEVIDYTIKDKEYAIIPNNLNIVTDIDLTKVLSYVVLLNGIKVSQTNGDYVVITNNGVSTIQLSDFNEGIITIIYQ